MSLVVRPRRLLGPIVGAVLVVVSLVLAQGLLVVKPLHEPTVNAGPPSSDPVLKPSVLFFTDLPLPDSGTFAPRIDVRVEAAPRLIGGCDRTTVEVNVEASGLLPGPGGGKGSYTRADVPDVVNFALTVFGPTPADNLKELGALYSQLQVTFDEISKVYPIELDSGEEWMATVYTGQIRDMARVIGGLRVSFQTDWSDPRSAGSCYVRLPRLMGPQVNKVFEIVGLAQREEWGRSRGELAPGHREARWGSVQAAAAAGSTISRASGDSLPEPTNPTTLTWTCTSDDDREVGEVRQDCGATTTVINEGIQRQQLFYLFVLAAILGLGLTIVYETVPPLRRTTPSREDPALPNRPQPTSELSSAPPDQTVAPLTSVRTRSRLRSRTAASGFPPPSRSTGGRRARRRSARSE